ncbi:MAG: hypothetical protein AVDCRST_MAG32-1736, partial [uncultured Nocardioides sp.]
GHPDRWADAGARGRLRRAVHLEGALRDLRTALRARRAGRHRRLRGERRRPHRPAAARRGHPARLADRSPPDGAQPERRRTPGHPPRPPRPRHRGRAGRRERV